MGIITRMRKQKAVYWEPTGRVDRNGNPVFEDPVEIDCRWEDVSELFLDENGNQQVSKAKVYVDRDVKLRGYLKLGEIYGISEGPLKYSDVHTIRRFERLPNLRNTETLRTAIL